MKASPPRGEHEAGEHQAAAPPLPERSTVPAETRLSAEVGPLVEPSRLLACWKPGELRGRLDEWKVIKNAPDAPRAPPDAALLPAPRLPAGLRGIIRRIRLPEGEKAVALTFDLCEQPDEITGYDGRIVDYLRQQGVKATFFAGGKWLLTHEPRARQILADPLFEFGNHTWEHRNLRIVSRDVLTSEIENAQRAYEKVRRDYDGLSCARPSAATSASANGNNREPPRRMSLFRFPFGACDAASLRAVNEAGLIAIQWDISSGDPWPLQTPDKIIKLVKSRVRPGSILLFHANGRGWNTAAALRVLIPWLRSEGYRFATVSELLHWNGASVETAASCYDSVPGDSDHYDDLARRLELRYQQSARNRM